jgi:AhpD family alkylhydroperoxidase
MFLPLMWTLTAGRSAGRVEGMTITDNTPQVPVRLDFDTHAAGFARAMAHLDKAATKELDRVDFDPRLRELVRIRASQLNGCVYCIDMHTADARKGGESEQRIYALPAWQEAPYYTARERAAFALTDAVTLISETRVPREVYDEAAGQFPEEELAQLISLILTINAWNRIAITTRLEPGT